MKNYRIYALFGCLCAALIFNAVVHLRSPAYKYYKEQVRSLRAEMEDYKTKINTDLVQSLIQVYSNTVFSATSNIVSVAGLSPSLVDGHERPKKLGTIAAQPGRYGNKWCFVFNRFPFFVGDSFFDGTILSIDATSCWTEWGYYTFSPPKVNDAMTEQEEKENQKPDERRYDNG